MASPYISDDQMPYPHNPVEMVPRINPGAVVHICQLRPGTWNVLAEWTGGEKVLVDGNQAVLLPGDAGTAKLGDYVASDEVTFWIEPAEHFNGRFWPTGVDPEWEWVCKRPWEWE